MGAQYHRVDIQPKHLTAHNTTRGHPIQHCLGPPRKNVGTQFVAWLSTKHCGHPKTSWVSVRLRGHPINIVEAHRKWCGSPAASTLLKRGVPPHVCGGPRSNNTWLHVEHCVDIQVLETWESVRNNVGTHITSVWLPTTCWVGVQNRGSVWEQVAVHVCPVWRCLDDAWVPSVDAVGERIIGIHVTCPHTGPCGHSMACYNYARPSLPISIKPSLLPLGEFFFNKIFFAKLLCVNLLRNTFAMFSVLSLANDKTMKMHRCGARSLTYGVV